MARKGGVATAAQAFDQVVEFLESFETLEDHRQRAKVLYPLDEILLLVLLGVLAGCESWVEIAKFGEKKLDLLCRFRPFKDGTPSHDQLGDIFAALDAAQFQSCFIAWVAKLTGLSADIIAIDGKTLRRSYQEGGATWLGVRARALCSAKPRWRRLCDCAGVRSPAPPSAACRPCSR